jgi:hypothetical protein
MIVEKTMAKKTAKNADSPTSTTAAPARRRAPAKKQSTQAAPAVDVATVGGTEPLAHASDTGTGASAETTHNDDGHRPSHDEIAQAAYFRHLNRGGSGGGEFDDWVEAERELRERRR